MLDLILKGAMEWKKKKNEEAAAKEAQTARSTALADSGMERDEEGYTKTADIEKADKENPEVDPEEEKKKKKNEFIKGLSEKAAKGPERFQMNAVQPLKSFLK